MMSRTRRFAALLATLVLTLTVSRSSAQAAASHQLIEGSGSSWATNALNVWIANVTSSGLKVVFTSTGSAQGRKDFGNQTTDFAVSDIGYQGQDPQTHDTDLPCKLGASNDCRKYAYLPIVAGGTAFPYHIEVAGQLVKNLRLSGETLAKIFTGQITNWNDPQITRDNHGRALPSLQIIPVSHAEGSGSSAQFTAYLDSMYPSIYRAYMHGPGETEYFQAGGNGVQQTGSDGVINFITSAAANGSIGYDEYSYALAKNYPVAKLENSAGYYTLPTQFNVAVALQKAQIDMDPKSPNYLLQKLDNVYRATDPRTYPLSSYSYMIIPTASDDSRMNSTAKRQTLADFIYYSVCDGQGQVGPVGYSSLPLNLVQASFDQTQKLKQADPGVDLSRRNVTTCNNPTFVPGHLDQNRLAQIAPQPSACDKDGAGPCTGQGDSGTSGIPRSGGTSGSAQGGSGGVGAGGGTGGTAAGGGAGTSAGSGGGGGTARPGTGGGGIANTPGTPGGGVPAAGGALNPVGGNGSTTTTGATTINPDTGQVVAQGTGTGVGDSTVVGEPTNVAYRQQDMTGVLAPLAAAEMLAVLVLPPIFYYLVLRRRKKKQS